jgi:hypothetical protein
MTSILQVANGIGRNTVEKLLAIGINSVEKLASASIESLLVIDDIGIKNANSYIQFAKNHLEKIKAKEKIYNIINKGIKSNGSDSQEKVKVPKPVDKKIKPKVPISSIKKLASASIEDVTRMEKLGIPTAKRYVEIAKKYLESMRIEEENETKIEEEIVSSPEPSPEKQLIGFIRLDSKKEPKKIAPEISISKVKPELKPEVKVPKFKTEHLKKPQIDLKAFKQPPQIGKKGKATKVKTKAKTTKPPVLKTFFPEETTQRIRFLHFNIKKLEEKLKRKEDFSFAELNHVIDYIKILNVNYKTQSQIRIFKDLEITPSFYDPVEKKDIRIWDLIFECSRVLWISAQAYAYLANKFEAENLMENAIVATVECSKMYKTSAYFSAACTRQEERGTVLSVENLEMNSEESRILAQNLATISEERKGNYSMAANLSAGLSALTKRLAFLRIYDEIKENQFKAQYIYDMGKACDLKAKSLIKISTKGENEELIENFQKKANYYFAQSEEIWEHMLENFENLTLTEKESIKTNLSIVNENIIENDVELIDDNKALEIQDPEPLIIVPENLAPFIPRTTNFLTKSKPSDLNFDAYLRYKNLMSDVLINMDKIDELKNKKAGIGRTMKQLKILYDNTDIDINSFTELYEKYSIKLETIENAIRNLKDLGNNNNVKRNPVKIFKPSQ